MFFCTQLPTDVPNDVLSQLGARVQHALRAFTPDDQKALTKTVRTYPKTNVYDLESALTSLGIGEAIVTVLSEKGAPTPVAWTRMRAPRSLMDTIGPERDRRRREGQPAGGKYGQTIDRDSAYERLAAKLARRHRRRRRPLLPTCRRCRRRWRYSRCRCGQAAESLLLREDDEQPGVQERDALRRGGIGRGITRSIFGTGRRRRR